MRYESFSMSRMKTFQVKSEGKTSYLTAVCMSCLEGWTGGGILCRYCIKPWNGSHLILGTMYSYDIFAAMPCCSERLKVFFLQSSTSLEPFVLLSSHIAILGSHLGPLENPQLSF